MKKKRKSGSSRTLKTAGEALIGVAIAMVLVVAVTGIVYAGKYAYDLGHEYFTRKEPSKAPSPAELIDEAMQIKGAFVIGPRRDLVEMGILIGIDEPRHVGGPAIAIRTKTKLCIWSLGYSALRPSRKSDFAEWATIGSVISGGGTVIGSGFYGFEGAYERFKTCIAEGNTIDPIKHHGAKCDGKHSDAMAMHAAMQEAVKLPMGRVQIPDGCVMATVAKVLEGR